MGELWAWPSALKLALLDHLRARADELAASRAHRLAADRLAAALEAAGAPAHAGRPQVHPAFVIRLLQRSREREPGGRSPAPTSSTRRWPREARPSKTRSARRADTRRAEQAGMANLIGSLAPDFDVRLERVLRERQPRRAGAAARSGRRLRPDGLPQPRSLSARRRRTGRARPATAQLRVALKSVERARQVARARRPTRASAHVGYHLIGGGRRQFERSIGWTATGGASGYGGCSSASATPGYLGTIAVGTAVLVAAARRLRLRARLARRRCWRWSALLTVVPASELTIQILQRIISYLIPPRRLPRLELDAVPDVGADDGDRADDARQRRAASRNWSRISKSRRSATSIRTFTSRILSDFRDAATETLPHDAEILAAAARGHRGAQRASTPNGGADRFFLFHRLRQWNERKGSGWDGSASAERSRSSIACCAAPPTPASSSSVGDVAILPQRPLLHHARQRHAAAARRGASSSSASSPIRSTAPSFDPAARPGHRRLRHPAAAGQRHVHERRRVALRAAVLRPHRRRSVHDGRLRHLSGSLRRRHLHRARACTTSTRSRPRSTDSVPENALLSHDLFEGLHARVALVSDVELVDEYPSSVLVARPAAASLDSRRLADPLLAVPVRAVAPRPQAQHAAAHRALEDPRQPAPQPGRADAARAARRRHGRCCPARTGSGR